MRVDDGQCMILLRMSDARESNVRRKEMIKDSMKRAKQAIATLICASMLFWAPNPHAWANPVVNAAAVRTVPAGVGHLGMAAMGAGAMDVKLAEMQLAPAQSTLGTS